MEISLSAMVMESPDKMGRLTNEEFIKMAADIGYHGICMRASLAGTQTPRENRLELKRDLDSRIQHVPVQLARYLDMLDPDGRGLREDVAESYRQVCEQLRALGRSAPDPSLIQPGMEVIGLVALANYNPKSALLGRALEKAGKLERRIYFCFLGTNGIVPAPSRWFVAAGA